MRRRDTRRGTRVRRSWDPGLTEWQGSRLVSAIERAREERRTLGREPRVRGRRRRRALAPALGPGEGLAAPPLQAGGWRRETPGRPRRRRCRVWFHIELRSSAA